tara:strand:+ start:463 stop:1341 length:879 start_codon:yes stop_codon:yes gene_type:complete
MITKLLNATLQYSYGFSFLMGKKLYGISRSTFDLAYKNITAILPFLSQSELLGWTKKLSSGVETIYDKAMDAEYIKTHIGGPYHRLFDGGHSPVLAWEKVKNASETDSFTQEVIGYVSAMWRDATTKMGMPYRTINKDYFDKTAEALNTTYGIKKSWLNDFFAWDVVEIFSTALGMAGGIFFLKKNDMNKLSEILGSMGIISVLTANRFMGIMVIVQTVWTYVIKKKKLENSSAIKGASLSLISWSIFSILGLPILIELVIALSVLRLFHKKHRIKINIPKILISKTSRVTS